MGERDCEKECTCKSSLGHYLIVAGGVLRAVSVVVGLVFSTSQGSEVSKTTIDKVVEIVEIVGDKLTE